VKLPYQAASVALPCPMGLRPGACGCGSAACAEQIYEEVVPE